jgi:hypothetical protein
MRRAPGNQKGFGRPEQSSSRSGGRACRAQAGRLGDGTRWDTADLRLRLALLRIGEVAEFAKPGTAAKRRSKRFRPQVRQAARRRHLQENSAAPMGPTPPLIKIATQGDRCQLFCTTEITSCPSTRQQYMIAEELGRSWYPRCPPLHLIGKGSDTLVELPHSHFALHS